MASGCGVRLVGAVGLPNPIGKQPALAVWMQLAHVLLTYAAVVVASRYAGLGLKKHLYEGARFLHRMLPFTRG